MRMYVEGWQPGYGSPTEPEQAFAPSAEEVDYAVEAVPWEPQDGHDDGIVRVAFVDGVERIDARLTLDAATGPISGIFGSYGVGAVVWDRSVPRSTFEHLSVERVCVQSQGAHVAVPPLRHGLAYLVASVEGDDPASPVRHLHERMRSAETDLSAALSDSGVFVVADGPISELRARPIVGMIKTHRASYLDHERLPIMRSLVPGARSPLFLIRSGRYSRYSWYLRLAEVAGGHSWSGIVRCVTPEAVGLEEAMSVADRTAALLPQVASEQHVDPRAPQNLVPIGALERELRRQLGDQALVYRALREAMEQQRESA